MRPQADAYGHEVWDFHMNGEGYEVIEREDGLVDPSEVAPEAYFAPFEEWPEVERKGIAYTRGKVLDVGCGAGRVCLYLQSRKKPDVVGIDNSPLALKVAKARGVRKTRLLAFRDVDFAPRSFDTVVMYGNNFGLFANKKQARRLLRRLHVMTTAGGRVVCSSVDPHKTNDPDHLRYQRWNRARGRMPGQVRIRARYRTYIGDWFDYLLVSPEEMKELVVGTGWRVGRFIHSKEGPLYVGVLEKGASRPTSRRPEPV